MILTRRTDANASEWDDFVRASANGTIFHRLDFLAYHRDRFRQQESHLVWKQGETLKAVMPLALLDEDDGVQARSPFGASYGGIVHQPGLTLAEAEEMVGLLMAHLHQRGVTCCTLTPPPTIYSAQASDYITFFLLKAGFRLVNSDLTAYIPVSAQPLECSFSYAAAKAVRKAQREGVVVTESREVNAFYDILLENRSKFDAVPTHTLEEIIWLMEHLGDDIRLFMATLKGRPIAGTLVFRCNDLVLLDFYWAHLEKYQSHRPVNLLVHEVTRWAAGQDLRWFDFGTQTVNMIPNYGGSRFKETFGSTGAFRHTYRWEAQVHQ